MNELTFTPDIDTEQFWQALNVLPQLPEPQRQQYLEQARQEALQRGKSWVYLGGRVFEDISTGRRYIMPWNLWEEFRSNIVKQKGQELFGSGLFGQREEQPLGAEYITGEAPSLEQQIQENIPQFDEQAIQRRLDKAVKQQHEGLFAGLEPPPSDLQNELAKSKDPVRTIIEYAYKNRGVYYLGNGNFIDTTGKAHKIIKIDEDKKESLEKFWRELQGEQERISEEIEQATALSSTPLETATGAGFLSRIFGAEEKELPLGARLSSWRSLVGLEDRAEQKEQFLTIHSPQDESIVLGLPNYDDLAEHAQNLRVEAELAKKQGDVKRAKFLEQEANKQMATARFLGKIATASEAAWKNPLTRSFIMTAEVTLRVPLIGAYSILEGAHLLALSDDELKEKIRQNPALEAKLRSLGYNEGKLDYFVASLKEWVRDWFDSLTYGRYEAVPLTVAEAIKVSDDPAKQILYEILTTGAILGATGFVKQSLKEAATRTAEPYIFRLTGRVPNKIRNVVATTKVALERAGGVKELAKALANPKIRKEVFGRNLTTEEFWKIGEQAAKIIENPNELVANVVKQDLEEAKNILGTTAVRVFADRIEKISKDVAGAEGVKPIEIVSRYSGVELPESVREGIEIFAGERNWRERALDYMKEMVRTSRSFKGIQPTAAFEFTGGESGLTELFRNLGSTYNHVVEAVYMEKALQQVIKEGWSIEHLETLKPLRIAIDMPYRIPHLLKERRVTAFRPVSKYTSLDLVRDVVKRFGDKAEIFIPREVIESSEKTIVPLDYLSQIAKRKSPQEFITWLYENLTDRFYPFKTFEDVVSLNSDAIMTRDLTRLHIRNHIQNYEELLNAYRALDDILIEKELSGILEMVSVSARNAPEEVRASWMELEKNLTQILRTRNWEALNELSLSGLAYEGAKYDASFINELINNVYDNLVSPIYEGKPIDWWLKFHDDAIKTFAEKWATDEKLRKLWLFNDQHYYLAYKTVKDNLGKEIQYATPGYFHHQTEELVHSGFARDFEKIYTADKIPSSFKHAFGRAIQFSSDHLLYDPIISPVRARAQARQAVLHHINIELALSEDLQTQLSTVMSEYFSPDIPFWEVLERQPDLPPEVGKVLRNLKMGEPIRGKDLIRLGKELAKRVARSKEDAQAIADIFEYYGKKHSVVRVLPEDRIITVRAINRHQMARIAQISDAALKAIHEQTPFKEPTLQVSDDAFRELYRISPQAYLQELESATPNTRFLAHYIPAWSNPRTAKFAIKLYKELKKWAASKSKKDITEVYDRVMKKYAPKELEEIERNEVASSIITLMHWALTNPKTAQEIIKDIAIGNLGNVDYLLSQFKKVYKVYAGRKYYVLPDTIARALEKSIETDTYYGILRFINHMQRLWKMSIFWANMPFRVTNTLGDMGLAVLADPRFWIGYPELLFTPGLPLSQRISLFPLGAPTQALYVQFIKPVLSEIGKVLAKQEFGQKLTEKASLVGDLFFSEGELYKTLKPLLDIDRGIWDDTLRALESETASEIMYRFGFVSGTFKSAEEALGSPTERLVKAMLQRGVGRKTKRFGYGLQKLFAKAEGLPKVGKFLQEIARVRALVEQAKAPTRIRPTKIEEYSYIADRLRRGWQGLWQILPAIRTQVLDEKEVLLKFTSFGKTLHKQGELKGTAARSILRIWNKEYGLFNFPSDIWKTTSKRYINRIKLEEDNLLGSVYSIWDNKGNRVGVIIDNGEFKVSYVDKNFVHEFMNPDQAELFYNKIVVKGYKRWAGIADTAQHPDYYVQVAIHPKLKQIHKDYTGEALLPSIISMSQNANINYLATTSLERRWLAGMLIPFYTFMSRMSEMLVRGFFNHPVKMAIGLSLPELVYYLWNHRSKEASEATKKLEKALKKKYGSPLMPGDKRPFYLGKDGKGNDIFLAVESPLSFVIKWQTVARNFISGEGDFIQRSVMTLDGLSELFTGLVGAPLRLAKQRFFREEGYGLADQLWEDYAGRWVRISKDGEQLYRELYKKFYEIHKRKPTPAERAWLAGWATFKTVNNNFVRLSPYTYLYDQKRLRRMIGYVGEPLKAGDIDIWYGGEPVGRLTRKETERQKRYVESLGMTPEEFYRQIAEEIRRRESIFKDIAQEIKKREQFYRDIAQEIKRREQQLKNKQ